MALKLDSLVGPVYGYFGDEFYEKYVFHHGGGVAVLLRESPAKPQLVVQSTVFPFQQFVQRVLRPFT